MKRKLLIGGFAALLGGVALGRATRRGADPAAPVAAPADPVATPPPGAGPPHRPATPPPDPAAERERVWQAFLASPCGECGQAAGVVERTGTRVRERVFEGGGELGRPAYPVLQDEKTFYPYYACTHCGAVREPPA